MNFEILVASNNKHKLQEIRDILSPHHITVYGMNDLNIKVPEPEETGKTYYENALIKAQSLLNSVEMPIIADDSGIEILSLNNEPGIYSARYAEQHGGYDKTFEYILSQIKDKDPSSKFVCDIVLIGVEDKPLLFEAVVEGKIVNPKGSTSGFGYDPIFYVNECGKTYSEMGQEDKNKYSHRARALKKLLTYLKISGFTR